MGKWTKNCDQAHGCVRRSEGPRPGSASGRESGGPINRRGSNVAERGATCAPDLYKVMF